MGHLTISKSKAFIDFMLAQQQWSGITKSDIEKWLNNFKDLDENEKQLVYKLLTNIIYFSEKDILALVKKGVFLCLAYDDVLEAQKTSNFALSKRALTNIYECNLRESCFVPLLDSNSPHESGNYILRTLVQHGIIPANKSMFIERTPQLVKKQAIKNLVIVDDCVGSGDQLTTFWETKKVFDGDEEITIKEMCEKYNVKAHYLTLFGYDKNIDRLSDKFKDLNIHCVRRLSEEHRVFSESSYIWENCDERNKAKELFSSLTMNAGIPLYGYRSLDFALIMHQTIPDWSLPLFWKENADWNLLIRRKNSND